MVFLKHPRGGWEVTAEKSQDGEVRRLRGRPGAFSAISSYVSGFHLTEPPARFLQVACAKIGFPCQKVSPGPQLNAHVKCHFRTALKMEGSFEGPAISEAPRPRPIFEVLALETPPKILTNASQHQYPFPPGLSRPARDRHLRHDPAAGDDSVADGQRWSHCVG